MSEQFFLARCLEDFSFSNGKSKEVAHFYLKNLENKDYLYKNRSQFTNLSYFKNKEFALNWYKNEHDKDVSLFNSISWGNILACGLIQAIAYCYKEYNFLKALDGNSLKISDKEDVFFIEIAKHIFKDKLELYPGVENKNYTDAIIRRYLQPPRSNWKFRFLSALTFFNNFLRRNKKLVIADGSVIDFYRPKKDFVFLNTKIFNQSVYFNYKKDSKLAEKVTPPWIFDQSFYLKNLRDFNERNNFFYEDDFLQILSKIFVLHAEMNVKQIQDWICYYQEVFEKYRPTEVHFPGDKIEFYCAGAEVAKSMGIKTSLLWDGVSTFEESLFFKKENGGWLFDHYIVFDDLTYNSLLRSEVSKENITRENIPHPMIKKILEIESKNIYDVVIFTWIPLEYNPYCFPDLLPKILQATLVELKKKNLKIAVKFKAQSIVDVYKSQMNDDIFSDVDIFMGPPTEVMPYSKAIITGVSTAIFEARAIGKKVFIYEPPENGFCKEMLNFELLEELKFYTNIQDLIKDI